MKKDQNGFSWKGLVFTFSDGQYSYSDDDSLLSFRVGSGLNYSDYKYFGICNVYYEKDKYVYTIYTETGDTPEKALDAALEKAALSIEELYVTFNTLKEIKS